MSQYIRKHPIVYNYPYEYPLRLLGRGKWESRIMIDIALYKQLRYCELKDALYPISDTILTSSLRRLIEEGMVVKNFLEQGNSLRVFYTLSEKSYELITVLQSFCRWNEKYGIVDDAEMAPECKNCPIRRGVELPHPQGCEQGHPFGTRSVPVFMKTSDGVCVPAAKNRQLND